MEWLHVCGAACGGNGDRNLHATHRAELGPTSLFFGANAGELLGRHATERVYGYARLEGAQGTVVEITFASDWLGHGYGVARTSFKEEYRVTF